MRLLVAEGIIEVGVLIMWGGYEGHGLELFHLIVGRDCEDASIYERGLISSGFCFENG
jgi:hypothetical protein